MDRYLMHCPYHVFYIYIYIIPLPTHTIEVENMPYMEHLCYVLFQASQLLGRFFANEQSLGWVAS